MPRRNSEGFLSIPHIAIAEDHFPDVLAFRESLARRGIAFTLEHYSDGETAAKAIAAMTAPPDLLVVDLNLPRVDGFEVLNQIRNNPVTRHVPVMILTSSSAPADRIRAQQYGAALYLVKPGEFGEFLKKVAAGIQSLLAESGSALPGEGSEKQGGATA